jgi:hypothetical protein
MFVPTGNTPIGFEGLLGDSFTFLYVDEVRNSREPPACLDGLLRGYSTDTAEQSHPNMTRVPQQGLHSSQSLRPSASSFHWREPGATVTCRQGPALRAIHPSACPQAVCTSSVMTHTHGNARVAKHRQNIRLFSYCRGTIHCRTTLPVRGMSRYATGKCTANALSSSTQTAVEAVRYVRHRGSHTF